MNINNNAFCSYPAITRWLQNYLIPCPLKYFTGFDCPLCGFQRSVLALLQGQWVQSFKLYPAAIPIILTAMYLVAKNYLSFNLAKPYQKMLYGTTLAVIFIAYAVKVVGYF